MSIPARDLAAALEPLSGQVYFAPESHENYVSLGFAASPSMMGAVALPDALLGEAWRLADRLREFRRDAHISSWLSAGFDAVEIGLLSELYWGLPMRTYVRSRGWSDGDLEELVRILSGRSTAIQAAGGYPQAGSHDLAKASSGTG